MSLRELDNSVDLESNGKTSNSYLFKMMPKSGDRLIGRFITIPDGSKRPYIAAPYHEYLIGPDPIKHKRFHFSRQAVGDQCPIADKFWDLMKARKRLKDREERDTPEYKRIESEISRLRIKNGGLFLFLEHGTTKVTPLFLKESVIRLLLGGKGWGDQAPTEGLVKEAKKDGIHIFNLTSPTGWVELTKKGQGKDTQFFVTLAETSTTFEGPNGKPMKAKIPIETKVPDAVLDMEVEDLPNLLDVLNNERMMWSNEECVAFVEDNVVPERCLKGPAGSGESKPAPQKQKASWQSEEPDFEEKSSEPAFEANTAVDELEELY